LSADLISPKLKNKKHYNSFHPKLGEMAWSRCLQHELMCYLQASSSIWTTSSPGSTLVRLFLKRSGHGSCLFSSSLTICSLQKSALNEKEYEPLLKEDLNCFVCEKSFKNIPKLKEHLQEEWDKKAKKAKRTSSNDDAETKKRKRED
jgi:aprataxin